MQQKTAKQNKVELIVVGIALVVFVLSLVAHLAGASIANSSFFGYIAAPIPFILGIIVLISYKIAETAED
jgi:Na+(H+)/acetate symporter ActP